jgi:hypothetical protein
MNGNSTKDTIAKKGLLGLFVGLGIWTTLLLQASIVLRNEKTATYNITCGPFNMNTITRHESADGISAAINFHSGLLYFLLLCVASSILLSLLRRAIAKN